MMKEALVVCSDKSLSAGITVWDIETGDHLLHIPTCASPPHGLVCLRNHFLVASQIQKQGSVAGGAIFIWPLNKPHAPLRNYPIEATGPLCCTKDGLYLAGGTLSGKAYVWEVSSGRMLKCWHAHKKSLTCLNFSSDNSFLISGSNEGEIRVWSTISLLDMTDFQSVPSFFHAWMEHQSSITGLLTSDISSSVLISSSLDGTCKIWDLISNKVVRTHAFPLAITAITLDPEERFLFSGSSDGRIFVNTLDAGLEEENEVLSEEQSLMVLSGHKGAITALSFSLSGLFLISASEDCTACLWDVKSWAVIHNFSHKKAGHITNIVVIPQSLLLPRTENLHKVSFQFRVSPLDKYPQPESTAKRSVTLLPKYCSLEHDHIMSGFQITHTMNQQIMDLEQDRTPEAIQMKVDTIVERRLWATSMAKHVTEMNKHLRSRLLDLMQSRLSCPLEFSAIGKRRQFGASSVSPAGDECREYPTY
ncbi:hypothetical protein AQUCO_00201277v1 [Aquilegia coerulea]|uniref:Uncharacterized protein n=1 Tax=Aquilegia coerulea TaxID=218851 RepID=A0A2G5F747_AQUCA|nr:hypothetical protein AQUCO_00201277v1 [Aquilegia coerulea]